MLKFNYRSQLGKFRFAYQSALMGILKVKKNLILVILFLLVLVIHSCKKDQPDIVLVKDPIESARNALTLASNSQKINIDNESYRQKLGRKVLWEKAFSKKIGDSTMIYAPITLSEELFIKNNGKNGVSVNNISWLVVSEIRGKYKFYMVMKLPDQDLVSTAKFKGLLFVDDWFGKGESFYIKKGFSNNSKVTPNNNVTATMAIICITVKYTICTSMGNDPVVCIDHSDSYCESTGNGNGGGIPLPQSMDPDDGSIVGGGGGGGGGIADLPETDPVDFPVNPADVMLPENKLCSSTFVFSTVVQPGQGSRGWKEAAVKDLSINVLADNYLENIWAIITSGTPFTSVKFNLTIGVPGDLPNAIIAKETALAANVTMAQIEKSYGTAGLKLLINSGTLPQKIAALMQIQLASHIDGARVSTSLNGSTVPNTPKTGTNCD